MTLIDTNILVDILTNDLIWLTWSAEQLDRCRYSGSLYINGIAYAFFFEYPLFLLVPAKH